MFFPELSGYKKIHLIGIGGVHMSCIAEILKNNGYDVSGSDSAKSNTTDNLVKKGIKVYIGHSAGNIQNDISLVIKTAAVKDFNPELIAAASLGIPVMERGRALGIIMKAYKYPVCVSGVHGKTTTTAMLAEIFTTARLDPTIVNGGYTESIGGMLKTGGSEYFLAEACEYHDSFLDFFPYVGVILNIEADHLDYFSDFRDIFESFKRFAELIPKEGTLVINGEIPGAEEIIKSVSCKCITFLKGDVTYDTLEYADGRQTFGLMHKGVRLGEISLKVPGKYNSENALAAVAACIALNVPLEAVREGLERFSGARRRFQYKGRLNGGELYDDYAHHPTEIKAALGAAKQVSGGGVWCVFQPHTKSRTKSLFKEFSTCFRDADKVVLIDIFEPSGREEHEIPISSENLYLELKRRNIPAKYYKSRKKALEYIKENFDGNMLITMGAGDVYLLGEQLVLE